MRHQYLAVSFIVYCLLFAVYNSFAQETPPPVNNNEDQKIEERIENIAQTADESTDFTELAENLKYFSEHPINLNRTTREELLQLGLLTDLQIDALFKHIARNGNIIAVQELQTIDGFDMATIYSILPYARVSSSIDVNASSFSKIMSNGTHQVLLRSTRILEDQKGFLPPADSTASHYLGNPWKLYARYRFTYQRKISWGVTAEKDQGEEFFAGTQKSFDFYSAHLFIRDVGPFKVIALGDYQLEYGQGLTLWSGLAFGKSSEVMAVKKNAAGITPYASVNEVLFKRGAAVSVGTKKIRLDAFYSNHDLDANLTDTINLIEEFSSFQEAGYHRTLSELADKGSINEQMFGGHLDYKANNLSLGFTAVHAKYDKSLAQTPYLYNEFYFKGDELTNTGINYSYLYRNIDFFGEVARSDNGAVAYLNGAMISLDPRVAFSVLNRNYPRDYHTLYANPLRESSTAINERGTYFGLLTRPARTLTLSGYFDVFTFPWLRYQVNAPSGGYEYITQVTCTPNKKTQLYFRYKQTVKDANVSGNPAPLDYLVSVNQKNYRFDIVSKITSSVSLHSRVELINYHEQDMEPDKGFLIFQDVNYKPMGFPLSFSFRYALFDTKSYNSRIYAYENDVLYYYSIPSYYYKGSRYYLTLRYKVKKGIDVWLRYAQTVYANQDVISSGLDEIDGNAKSEVKMELRLEF